jgi:hypothetical protein
LTGCWTGRGFADQEAGFDQLLDDHLLGLLGREAGNGGVGVGIDSGRRVGVQPAVAADDGAHRQIQLAPPRDVGGVAERADHRDAGALVGLREFVRADLDLLAVERHRDGGAEVRLVALVVGVRDQSDAGGEEFWTGGVDLDRAVSVGSCERDLVVGARAFAVFHLGLRDGGAEVDVPEGRCLLAVGLAAGDVAQERPLAGAA